MLNARLQRYFCTALRPPIRPVRDISLDLPCLRPEHRQRRERIQTNCRRREAQMPRPSGYHFPFLTIDLPAVSREMPPNPVGLANVFIAVQLYVGREKCSGVVETTPKSKELRETPLPVLPKLPRTVLRPESHRPPMQPFPSR
jgi:hypothetical protein